VKHQRFTPRNCIRSGEQLEHMARSIAANIAKLPEFLRKP
jgi:hypothetical protein